MLEVANVAAPEFKGVLVTADITRTSLAASIAVELTAIALNAFEIDTVSKVVGNHLRLGWFVAGNDEVAEVRGDPQPSVVRVLEVVDEGAPVVALLTV